MLRYYKIAPFAGVYSSAWALSADGLTVVGEAEAASGEYVPFRWTVAGGMESLLPGGATYGGAQAVNGDGSFIAGYAGDATVSIFKYDAGVLSTYAMLPGQTSCAVNAISENGTVVGQNSVGGAYKAFRQVGAGALEELAPATGTQAIAQTVSADGTEIFGWSGAPATAHATRWGSGGTAGVRLDALVGGSVAFRCTPDGSVAFGHAEFTADGLRAFRWDAVNGMIDLGALPGAVPAAGVQISIPNACSDDGSVVFGTSRFSASTDRKVWRWTETEGMVALEIADAASAGVHGCNSDGSVAYGSVRLTSGQTVPFRWTLADGVELLNGPAFADMGETGALEYVTEVGEETGHLCGDYTDEADNFFAFYGAYLPDVESIVFEPLFASPDTRGDLLMVLPPVAMFAFEEGGGLAVMVLPTIAFAATGFEYRVGALDMLLPAIEWRAVFAAGGIPATYEGSLLMPLPSIEFYSDDADILVIQSADLLMTLPPVEFVSTDLRGLWGALDMALAPLAWRAYEEAGSTLLMELPRLDFSASNTAVIPENFLSLQAQPFMSILGSSTWVVTDSLTFGDTVTDEMFFVLRSRLDVTDTASFLALFLMGVESSIVARDFVGFVLDMTVDETLDLADVVEITPEAVLAIASQLVLQDETLGLMTAIATVTSALVLLDRVRYDVTSTVTSGLELADIVTANLALITEIASEAAFLDAVSGNLTMMTVVSSEVAFDDSFEGLLAALMTIDDTANFSIRFSTPEGDQYAGYLLNVRNAAVSELTHFNFNSFATVKRGGRVVTLAAGLGGIFELGGDTFDGEPIDARVRLGLSDFGNSQLKTMGNAVLGYTSSGRLRLKVITTDGGRKKENWYALKARAAHSPIGGSLNIAKGLVARYWGFEVENMDGADFQLDELKVWPLLIQRRNSGR